MRWWGRAGGPVLTLDPGDRESLPSEQSLWFRALHWIPGENSPKEKVVRPFLVWVSLFWQFLGAPDRVRPSWSCPWTIGCPVPVAE